jgi:hypothetical protein
MTDERNIADKKEAQDKRHRGEEVVENAAVVPQPGKKPPLIDDDTGPSNSVAHAMYLEGEEPRVLRESDVDAIEPTSAGNVEPTSAGNPD